MLLLFVLADLLAFAIALLLLRDRPAQPRARRPMAQPARPTGRWRNLIELN